MFSPIPYDLQEEPFESGTQKSKVVFVARWSGSIAFRFSSGVKTLVVLWWFASIESFPNVVAGKASAGIHQKLWMLVEVYLNVDCAPSLPWWWLLLCFACSVFSFRTWTLLRCHELCNQWSRTRVQAFGFLSAGEKYWLRPEHLPCFIRCANACLNTGTISRTS